MGLKKNASVIDLSNKNLDKIPDEIFSYENLQKLILRNNKIKAIPKEITSLKRLRMIDLSNNRIDILYAKFFSLTNLEAIYLNQNNLKSIPIQITQLKNLRRISLSGNKIKSLPKEFAELSNLEFLNISNNQFDEFPPEILKLKRLKSLRISNINFKSFPLDRINSDLVNLRSFYCFSTHIQKIRTQDTNRDYLFLATNKGNCLQRLKNLIEMSAIKLAPSEPDKKISRPKKTKPVKNLIFICYSHRDEKWRREVEIAIKSMQYEGFELDPWSDRRIKTSQKWKEEIFDALSKSKIAVLLISKYFLASDFIRNQELPRILEKASNNDLRIMNLIISYCRFDETEKLSQYQSVNPSETPLLSFGKDKRDFYLLKLTRDIDYFIKP